MRVTVKCHHHFTAYIGATTTIHIEFLRTAQFNYTSFGRYSQDVFCHCVFKEIILYAVCGLVTHGFYYFSAENLWAEVSSLQTARR